MFEFLQLFHAVGDVGEVAALVLGKLGKGAFFCDLAVCDDSDAVALLNGCEAVCYHDACAANHAVLQSGLNLSLRLLV